MGPLLRCVGRGLLYLYVALLLVVLVLRYWLLPNIDIWRQPISQILSNITQSEVQIGQIQAQWQGLYPEVELKDVYLSEKDAQPQIHIPSMLARFQLSSLFKAQPYFSFLRIEGLQLVLQRDPHQRLSIVGQSMNPISSSEATSKSFLSWVAQLQKIELHDATLIWQDHWRDTAPVHLTNVQGTLQHKQGQLQYEVTASPPVGLGETIRLLGALDSIELLKGQLSGTLYVQMTGLNAEAWHQWVDLPTGLVQANVESQIWLHLRQGQVRELSMDVQVHQGAWRTKEWGRFDVKESRLFVQGPWSSFDHFMQGQPVYEGVAKDPFKLELYAGAARWQDSPYLTEPLFFEELELVAHHAENQPQPKVIVEHLFLKNLDFEAILSGSWSPHRLGWEQSVFDLTAHAKAIQLPSLHKYFPTPAISTEVVDWLRTSIVEGVVPEAVMRWQGSIDNYPYAQPSQGLFYVGGPIVGAELDYYPATEQEKGWPKIEQIDGVLTIRGSQLWVHRAQGGLRPDLTELVQATAINVEIDDFSAEEPILTISAQTEGPAQAYLGLMTHSDLGALLDHRFSHTKATGNWVVPLHITVNLEHSDEVHVAGHIDFAHNDLKLMAELPLLKQVQGRLLFTEKEVEAQRIQAQWLGGPLLITQKIGMPKQALQLEGQFSVKALAHYLNLKSVALYAQGAANYTAKVGFDQEQHFFVTAESSLKGVVLHLPAPLEKRAEQEMPLTVSWSAENAQQHQLTLQLFPNLYLYLRENQRVSPVFDLGYLTWKRKKPAKLQRGLWIDIEESYLDLDDWKKVVEQFAAEAATGSSARLVDLHTLRIKAEEAHALNGTLNQLTYTMQQEPFQQWRSDVSSEQVAGTVFWQENSVGDVAGVVEAEFQRIHWQPKLNEVSAELTGELHDFDLELDDLNLTIDDFRYGAWHLGSLSVRGRRSKEDDALWRIPDIQLKNPYGNLAAQGEWRLDGVKRGLSLSAELHSTAMGSLLDYVGFKEVLADGQGHIKADVIWDQFPWQQSLSFLHADIEFDLIRGRLNQLQSHTGKLLEFLSLQSISRLATLGPDLRGLLQNGFPFDDIKGQVQLKNQIVSTHNFKVIGPVGLVLLEGEADVADETLDVEAVVVPSMDMSGAAIAAGFALNPVIGISAFLTQWLFKDPLAKAMTVQYQVTGPWDAIQVQEVKVKNTISPEPMPH